MTGSTGPKNAPPPLLRLRVEATPGDRRDFQFQRPFGIGRVEERDVCIKNEFVSRNHAAVTFYEGQWWIEDLGSSNGIFVNGQRTERAAIHGALSVRLGIEGPILSFEVQQPPAAVPSETVVARYIDRYFTEKPSGEPFGDHTRMVRQAFSQVQTKQKRKYGWIMGALGVLVLGAGGYAVYLHQQTGKHKAMAQDLFYTMKSLDLDIANVEKLVSESSNGRGADEIQKYQARRKAMEKNYDQFLTGLRVYDPKMTPQQRLILRIARVFGECELAMPPEFESEINSYIGKWRSSGRLARAVRTANENHYTAFIQRELLAQDLPTQFFYLALQESDFDPYISGPMTRMGIAKGMWQFIPDTAVKYGLRIGPLADFPRPDPRDDRHHFDRATKAASHYLKDLYSTDAQASGFLVMACYNWGEDQVLPLVRGMPANPRERNFWRLLSLHRKKLPKETLDYVFYIVSAAVIGENPRLFGFDFDNPLAPVGSQ